MIDLFSARGAPRDQQRPELTYYGPHRSGVLQGACFVFTFIFP